MNDRNYLFAGLALASMAASGYHGYCRSRGSVGWTAAWTLLGFVPATLLVAFAQGYAAPKKREVEA